MTRGILSLSNGESKKFKRSQKGAKKEPKRCRKGAKKLCSQREQ